MDYKHIVDIIQQDVKQIDLLLENFKNYKNIPQIEIDLMLSKIRNIYDQVLIINNFDKKIEVKKQVYDIQDYFEVTDNDSIDFIKDKINTINKTENLIPAETVEEAKPEQVQIVEPKQESVPEKEEVKTKEIEIPEVLDEEQMELLENDEPDVTDEVEIILEEEAPIKKPVQEIKKPHAKEKSKEIVSDKFQNSVQYRNEKLSSFLNKADVFSKIQSSPIPDISKAIGINDRFLLTKELFNGNTKSYQDTINYLNNAPDFDDAVLYITNNFDWDPDDENVQKILELIRRRHS